MTDTPVWEVVLYVDGPVTVRRRFRTTQQKGFRLEDPFYSDIEIVGQPTGLRATVTARAPDHMLAYKAAVYFFGHMIDALTLAINRPMYLSLTERERNYSQRHDVRRVIEPGQIEHAFGEAYKLARGSPSFLRSLGWYRKGLTTEDPLDKFLAFWNAIEIIASKYFHYVPSIDKERAKKGSKNQVWACFEALCRTSIRGSRGGWKREAKVGKNDCYQLNCSPDRYSGPRHSRRRHRALHRAKGDTLTVNVYQGREVTTVSC